MGLPYLLLLNRYYVFPNPHPFLPLPAPCPYLLAELDAADILQHAAEDVAVERRVRH